MTDQRTDEDVSTYETKVSTGPSGDDECIAAVRRFSRFYTKTLGLLDDGLLDTPHTLTEARALYEVAQQGQIDLTTLRQALGLDAGYVSRVISRLVAADVITRERSAVDGRRQLVRLTDQGTEAFEMLDHRSNEQVAELLDRLDDVDRRRLVGSLRTAERLLDRSGVGAETRTSPTVVLRPAGSGDHGWVVERHGALYAQQYRWDETFEGLVARVVAVFVDERLRAPDRNAAWIAEIDGERVGCVYCVEQDRTTAKLRLLLVETTARGSGVGSRLVDECIRFARRVGYRRIVLWTNDVLVEARRIYERAGFTLVGEEPHHSFGHDLVGQNWQLDLV